MTLEQISDPENGQVVLLFSSRTNLADTTLLRVQTVDIVTQGITGHPNPPAGSAGID